MKMSTIVQDGVTILPTHVVDNLGGSFKVIINNSAKCITELKTGDKSIEIPDFVGLVRAVATTRALHPQKLTGDDIRFLRKAIDLRSKVLAERLDISAEHLSRCENGEKVLSPNSEKMLRLLVILEPFRVLEDAMANTAEVKGLEKVQRKMPDIFVLAEKIRAIVSDMKIKPVANCNENELVFEFSYKRNDETSGVSRAENDDDQGEWPDPMFLEAA
jgi:DNA-binding transcriptional regulator YiaG